MNDKTWWKNGVIYHIYPRSFLDTNGDGIGDLQGIIRGLPYVRDLGANAIWMGPVFSSPQVDNGYDISDYRRIDPLFGTSEDMDTLIDTAHGLGIRVLLDLVFNHTSDRHQWFQASRARDPEYDDFYIWRDAAADGGRPNNWGSFFTVPAWTWDEKRQQYYLHLFTPEQPDLNWENPRVRAGLADTANFWLDRGVDGFRMDVINLISKKPGLPSIPPGTSPTGYFIDGPNVLDYLREFRALLHRSEEIVLVGETPGITAEPARRYTDPENHALDMVLLFEHLEIDHGPGGKWDHRPVEIQKIRSVLSSWQGTLSAPYWSSLYMSNHDQPRIVSRYGNDARYRFESATALAAVFFLQRGTPIVYQGDELSMRNFPITSTEHLVDIESRNAYAHMIDEGITPEEALRLVKDVTRDNGRTPMQWSTDRHAGFTTADEPWYPVNPDFPDCNVSRQSGERSASVLGFYRRLFTLRREHGAVREGGFAIIPVEDPSPVVAYRRGGDDAENSVIVVANLSDAQTSFRLPQKGFGLLLSNYESAAVPPQNETVVLRPWECLVVEQTRG